MCSCRGPIGASPGSPKRAAGPASLLVLLLAIGLTACTHNRPIRPSVAHRLDRVAVVTRLVVPPTVQVARGDPEAAGKVFEESPGRIDAVLEERLTEAIGRFELEEAVRSGFTAELQPDGPWQVVPPLEVASALGTLLAVEEPPDWTKLVDLEVDGVFDVTIAGWGLRDAGPEHPVGGWMVLRVRLLRPDTGKVLWSADVESDLSKRPPADDGLGFAELADSPEWAMRVAVAEAATDATRRLGAILDARRFESHRPPDAVD